MFEFDENTLDQFAKIKVIGAGKDGLNAINHMIDSGLEGVEFIALDTDAQSLSSSKSKNKILIDSTGPEKIFQSLKPFDAIFIVAGLDNSTGANVAPGIAKFAKASGSLTIAQIVLYEDTSSEQLDELKNNVDA